MATAPPQSEAGRAPATGTLLGKPAFIAALLLVVSAGMASAFLLLLPAAPDASALEAGFDEGIESVEVAIDSFSTTNSRAAPGSVIHLTFKLTAVVPARQQLDFEHAANQQHNARVRQAVLKVARSAGLEDLNDPSLATVKRQLREEINKVLHKSYVSEVVISDFKTMEQ